MIHQIIKIMYNYWTAALLLGKAKIELHLQPEQSKYFAYQHLVSNVIEQVRATVKANQIDKVSVQQLLSSICFALEKVALNHFHNSFKNKK